MVGVLETSLYHDAAESEAIERFYGETLGPRGGFSLARWGRVPRRGWRAASVRARSPRRARLADRRAWDGRPWARVPGRRRRGALRGLARASGDGASRSPTSTIGTTDCARCTSRTRPGTSSRSPAATSGLANSLTAWPRQSDSQRTRTQPSGARPSAPAGAIQGFAGQGARARRRDPGPVRPFHVHRPVDAARRLRARGADPRARAAEGRPRDAAAVDDPPRHAGRLVDVVGRDP